MRKSRSLIATVLLAALAASSSFPSTTASFTAEARASGNVVRTAALTQPRFSLISGGESSVGLWWQRALTGDVTPTYTVERSVAGGAPTTIYTGTDLDFTDSGNFPMHARTIEKVVAGEKHSLGLDDGGNVWAWGSNVNGQLGSFTLESDSPLRVLFPGGTVITDIAAGKNHSLAIDSNNNVWAWGANQFGQAGSDPNVFGDAVTIPVRVILADGKPLRATAVAAGGDHSLAVDMAGRVQAWGDNEYGQVGRAAGRSIDRAIGVVFEDGTPLYATAVAAGGNHSLAIDSDNEVVAWGMNRLGQLGDGTFTNSDVPVETKLADASGLRAKTISAGELVSLATTIDDTVMAWGVGSTGQLGNGTRLNQTRPEPVTFSDGRTFHASMVSAGAGHVLAIDGDKHVWAWGLPTSGALGNGGPNASLIDHPIETSGGLLADSVVAGSIFSIAVGSGTVWAWGQNSYGQLGTGDSTQRNEPTLASTTVGLSACPTGSVPVGDGSVCGLVAGTIYDYSVTASVGRWTASSGVASVRAGVP